ncbi:hypothetical protein JCM11641_002542 [Rhodosporidiobolus odoratus]
MNDDSLLSSFAHAQDFVAGTKQLTRLDYGTRSSADEDRREDGVVMELCAMLDEYQEQPHLLDPSLELLVSPLVVNLRQQVRLPDPPLSSTRLNRTARLVYYLTKVRGSKVIVRFFPHEASDLSLLLPLLLSSYNPAEPSTSSSSALSSASWELRYVLLLWLSVVVRLPFDLARLDATASATMEQIGFEALRRASKEGDGGAEVLAKFFSRQDAPLDDFLQACETCFTTEENPTLTTAHLVVLATVLHDAPPDRLFAHWSRLYRLLAFLPTDSSTNKGGALMAKMRCKVAGRLALLRLGERGQSDAILAEDDVPEAVEVIIGELVEGLGHSDTLPRYSAAKYLSRLCETLPPSFANQVIDAVLSTLEEALAEANEQGLADRAEGKIQGACLACGEMARRGLLGKGEEAGEQISRVVDSVLQALAFDHLYLSRSLGTSARDSAAYVFWALSRTLPTSFAQPHAQRIAATLVCTALFDREVQVRRAASAAFQEGVGRWSIFPNGIDVLRKIDFFTVSVRHRAYLEACPSVAEHEDYRPAVLRHLVEVGISHYDSDLRTLSANALGAVVALDSVTLAPDLVARQIEKVGETKDTAKLHGLLLSLAALANSTSDLPQQTQDELRLKIFQATTALDISCPRQLKSSPPVLAAALQALTASAPLPAPSEAATLVPSDWFELVSKACEHMSEEVHARAELDSRNGTRQQAAVLVLGKVDFSPASREHSELLPKLLKRLIAFVSREDPRKAATIEARRSGVEALASLLTRNTSLALIAHLLPSSLDALLLGFTDYTTDQRGDVGSWVRVVTLNSWARLLPALLDASSGCPAALSQEVVDKVVAGMAKQAVERLDNVREVAGRALVQLREVDRERPKGKRDVILLRHKEVWEGFARADSQSWRNLAWASEKILPLLAVPEYRDSILEGAVLASTQYSSSTPFLDFALSLPPTCPAGSSNELSLLTLLSALHTLGKTNFASNRFFLPFLGLLSSLAEVGCLDEVALEKSGQGEKALRALFGLAINGVAKVKNPQRLTAQGKVVTAFLALPHIAPLAAEKVPLFLCHSQSWLRQQLADDLFGQVSALGIGDGENGEEARLEELLTQTSWSTGVFEDEAKKVAELSRDGLIRREF